MLSDFISRLFIIGFFVVYLVVGIFVVQWIFRTWFGGARKPHRERGSPAPERAPHPEPPAAEPKGAQRHAQARADSDSHAQETPRHRSTTA